MATVKTRLWLLPAAYFTTVLAVTPAAGGAQTPYVSGQTVEITGTVTDISGQPLEEVEVMLKGYRRHFDPWRVRKVSKGEYRTWDVSDEKGTFHFNWDWDRFYNRFELMAGIQWNLDGEQGEEGFEALAELDLSKRILQGSPVVASLVIEDADKVKSWNAFRATIETEEQREVYQELGKPDKVTEMEIASHRDLTWWYFERGKAYRFSNGKIKVVETFDPVLPF